MENPVVTTQKIKLKFDIKAQSVDLVLDIKIYLKLLRINYYLKTWI